MSTKPRPVAVLLCPGRGSYGNGELGTLARTLRPDGETARVVALADAARQSAGEPTITELDGAARFRPSLHLDGVNAAELIYLATMAQVEQLTARDELEVAAVAGNSLGWYTALAAAGSLSTEDGWRLVRGLAQLQRGVAGGQILTTTVDAEWRVDPAAAAAVTRALEEVRGTGADHYAARSIRLGGHEVLAGTEAAVQKLLATLPRVAVGSREFPFRLAGHGPFHTELCRGVAEQAVGELARLTWQRPGPWLIDGRGDAHSPWSSDPAELQRYTATTQVTETFDFTAAVRTALREFNPDVLLCLGPGESLRAPVGHVVIAERYRGVHDREGLFQSGLVRVG